jgi:hypothetical protein
MAIGSREGQILDEWRLETGQAVKSVDDLAKAIRREMAHEKKLDLIRGELDKRTNLLVQSTKENTAAIDRQTKSISLATMKGNLYAKAIQEGAKALKSMVDVGLKWDDWIGSSNEDLSAFSTAAAGMIDQMELMKIKTQLMGSEFNATEKQVQAVIKAGVRWMRVNKDDLVPSIDKIVNAVKTGRDTVFRKLGHDIQFTGSMSDKTAQGLAMLEKKYGDVEVQIENTNEAILAAKGAWNDMVGQIGAAVIQGLRLKEVFSWIADFMRGHKAGAIGNIQIPVAGEFEKSLAAQRQAQRQAGVPGGPRRSWALPGYMTSGLYQPSGIEGGMPSTTKIRSTRRSGRGRASTPAADTHAGADDRKIINLEEERTKRILERQHALDMEMRTWTAYADAQRDAAFAADNLAKSLQNQQVIITAQKDVVAMGKGAVLDLAAGMWSAADAAIQGGKSFWAGMAEIVKASLLGTAAQATPKALLAWGDYWISMGANTAALTAAGYYTAAALVTGIGGLSLSAATANRGAGKVASPNRIQGGADTYRPSFGKSSKEQPDIYVNLYIENDNPAAMHLQMQTLKAQLQAA